MRVLLQQIPTWKVWRIRYTAPSPGASQQGKINSIHLKLGGWPGPPLKKYIGIIWAWYMALYRDDMGITFISKLVGGWPTPLKNISHMGLLFPTEWNNNPNVPNHQHLNTKIQTPKNPNPKITSHKWVLFLQSPNGKFNLGFSHLHNSSAALGEFATNLGSSWNGDPRDFSG